MTQYEIESLIMASIRAATAGLLSSHEAGRIMETLAKLDLSPVSAESAAEIYLCISGCITRNKRTINADMYHSLIVVADRIACHVQKLDDPSRRKRHIVRQ